MEKSRPSGDVAAKLVDMIRKRLNTAIVALNLVPRTSDADHPILRTEQAIDSVGGPLKRLELYIATIEQERTARDAECERLKADLELERWGINEIGSGLSREPAYDIAQSVIARRALGDQA